MLKAVEEFATECSFIKVFASETLDYVVDEGVQIHGGYGFHQDYAVEHAYRDSRINRIFEGTNEINRLLATGMMLKRAQKGTLPLVDAVKKLQGEILSGPSLGGSIDMVANAKKVGLLALGIAYPEIHDGDRGAAGGGREHHRHSDERVCPRIGYAAGTENRQKRAQCGKRERHGGGFLSRSDGHDRYVRRGRCWRRVPKATRCARIWRC